MVFIPLIYQTSPKLVAVKGNERSENFQFGLDVRAGGKQVVPVDESYANVTHQVFSLNLQL